MDIIWIERRNANNMTIKEMNKRRSELGYTYDMVARLSGVPKSTVQKVLGGITAFPHRSTLQALEKVFAEDSIHTVIARHKASGSDMVWVVDPDNMRVLLYNFDSDEMVPKVFKMLEI